MNQELLILKYEEIDAIDFAHKEGDKNTLGYQGRFYERLNLFFNLSQENNARKFCQKIIDDEGKQCLLIKENHQYSVWIEIKNTEEEYEVEIPYITQACLLIMQVLLDDIEDLMGIKQKKAFQIELQKILHNYHVPGTESVEKFNLLLSRDPLKNQQIPWWQEEQMEKIFNTLVYLGIKYFGSINFLNRTLELLHQTPVYYQIELRKYYQQFASLYQI